MRLLPKDSPVGWLPYTWLIYLSLYVVYGFLAHGSPLWFGIHAVSIVIFLALYLRGFWLDGRQLLPIMAGITAIGVLMIPWNPGASVFFVYAAGFAGDAGTSAVAVRCLAAILLTLGVETIVLRLAPAAWIPGVVITLMIGGGNIFFAEKRRANARLRMAQEELEHLAKVAERERIARDLHDLLGHTLSLIVLKSELAAKLAERDLPGAAAQIRDVERISRDALGEVRRAVQGYRQLTLDESLAGARQAMLAAGIAYTADVERVPMTAQAETVLALALREAVTNVIRHAQARLCELQLRATDRAIQLVVRDDGVGGSAGAGSGLAGMRERVEALGGRFEYDGSHGTRIAIELPIATEPRAGGAAVTAEAAT